MKKYLLCAALLVVASISAKAQFSLGIKGGVTRLAYLPALAAPFICSPKFM